MNQVPPTDSTSSAGDDAQIGRALRGSLLLIGLVVIGVALWWSGWGKPKQAPRQAINSIALDPPAVAPTFRVDPVSPFVFRDVTEEVGLGAVIPNGAAGQKLLPETMAGGCLVFDYDADGAPDVLTIGNSPWPDSASGNATSLRLYHNDGTGHFADVTGPAGLELSLHGMGGAAADYNNDGQIDLFVSCVGRNRLFRNQGGRFEDITATAGVAGDANGWSTSCAWCDYDHDGDLDLFVANYVAWSAEIDLQLDCTVTGTGRSYCRPELFSGSHVVLYRNDGSDRFTDVSEAAGLVVRDPHTQALMGKSLAMVAVDLELDGWLDLVVTNDTTPNFVFHNQRNGKFVEIGAASGIGFDSTGVVRRQFGVDAAWLPESHGWAVAGATSAGDSLAFFRAAPGLMQFADDSLVCGFGIDSRVPHKFTPLLCDFDLDGRLDVFIVNGQIDEDANKIRVSQTHEQVPDLYWNLGGGQFRRVPPEGLGPEPIRPIVGRGVSVADFDGDADPDLLLAANGGTPRLLRNDQKTGNHWYRVRVDNPQAVGCRVELTLGGMTQKWIASPHRGYLSQSELGYTFGLGNAKQVDRLVIQWTDGKEWERKDEPVDKILKIPPRPQDN